MSGDPRAPRPGAVGTSMGTSREPSVTFSMIMPRDDEASERSPPASSADPHRPHQSPPSIELEARRSRSRSDLSEFAPQSAAGGPLVIYQPEPMLVGHHPMLARSSSVASLYYPPPPPPPAAFFYAPPPPPFYTLGGLAAPPPHDPRAMRLAIKHARKLEKKQRAEQLETTYCYYCCDSIGKLLWAVILVTLAGFVAALMIALFVL